VQAAKQALKNAKNPVAAVSADETAMAIKTARRNLDIAKQNVMVAKLNVQRAKKPGVPLKDGIIKRFWKTKFLFLLFLPALIYYVVFKYVPMWGVSISFFDYRLLKGLAGSEFIGLRNFEAFFKGPDFWQITWNTIALSLQGLFISFPINVLFALLLNELRSQRFKKITQTISYMPHFLSTVIVCALVKNLLDPTTGVINSIIKSMGNDPIYFMMEPSMFRPIYLISGMWQGMGWSTIVYLAAISSVDPGLYEAARLDGAGRWRQMWSITLPSIAPTVATMFILAVGHVMDSSLDKCLLLQTGTNREVSETISTYIFALGMNTTNGQAMSTAIGLYNSLVNLALLMVANFVSKKVTETSVF
jgi:putative aldouronate transport system permease protein